MKLNQVVEGLKVSRDETGRKIVDFTSSVGDDSYFSGVTSTSDFLKRRDVNLRKDDISQEEWDEIERHFDDKPDVYQDTLPVYPGMPLRKDDNGRTEKFLDALKRRDEENISFTEEGLDKFIQKSAKSVVYRVSKDMNFKFYDQVVVVPIPSGKRLAGDFAKNVAEVIKGSGVSVRISNLLSKNPAAKYGSLLRTRHGRTITFRPEAWNQLLGQVKKGQVSGDEAINHYENRVVEINKQLNQLQKIGGPAAQQKADALKQEMEFLTPYFEKLMDVATDPRFGDTGDAEEIKSIQGFLKRMSYDRFNIEQDTITSQRKKDKPILIVLVDDNIDSASSLVDAYRTLFKKGVLDPKTKTIAITMHKLL